MSATWRRPSAWVPIVMSLAALSVVIIHIVRFGTAREADEGTSAHLWQILMAGQLPIVLWFLIKQLPETPKPALRVLVIQAIAGIAALAPVFYLGL